MIAFSQTVKNNYVKIIRIKDSEKSDYVWNVIKLVIFQITRDQGKTYHVVT